MINGELNPITHLPEEELRNSLLSSFKIQSNNSVISQEDEDDEIRESLSKSLFPEESLIKETFKTSAFPDLNQEDYKDYLPGDLLPVGADLQEERAKRQSTLDKWGNGAVKMLGTAATSFLEPFADLTVGVAQAIGTGKISGVYDNVVTQQFDKLNNYLREEFPNYYTKAEEEANIAEGLLTANFWADKALNGAGYMLGAIGSGMVTGGLALGTRATGATKVLQGISKEYSAAKKALDVANLTKKEARLISLSLG